MASDDIQVIRLLAALVLSSGIIYLIKKYTKYNRDDNDNDNDKRNQIELKEILISESRPHNKYEQQYQQSQGFQNQVQNKSQFNRDQFNQSPNQVTINIGYQSNGPLENNQNVSQNKFSPMQGGKSQNYNNQSNQFLKEANNRTSEHSNISGEKLINAAQNISYSKNELLLTQPNNYKKQKDYRSQLYELVKKNPDIYRCQIDPICEYVWMKKNNQIDNYCPMCDEWEEILEVQTSQCMYCNLHTESFYITPCGHRYHHECVHMFVKRAEKNTEIQCYYCTKPIHQALILSGYITESQLEVVS